MTEGDVAILQCQVGNQIGQVQWTKDGLTLGRNEKDIQILSMKNDDS